MITKKRILIVGDVMLDTFITGECQRVSPEAPVPVVEVEQIFHRAGGAANLAVNLKGLDMDCILVGRVGNDHEADILKSILNAAGIEYLLHTTPDIPTTQKTRVLARNQQMLRIDREKSITLTEGLGDIVRSIEEREFDMIAVSDYEKGLCSAYLMQLLAQKAERDSIKLLIDPKGKYWDKYAGSFLVKPNIHELEEITGVRPLTDVETILEEGRKLLINHDIVHLLVTRGGEDSILMDRKDYSLIPVDKAEVYDVTGAGDTTFAALIYGINHGLVLTDAAVLANKAGAIAVSKPYTYAVSLKDLQNLML